MFVRIFYLSSTDDSKESVTVWAKYLNASEGSYLACSENAIDYWFLSYHSELDVNP